MARAKPKNQRLQDAALYTVYRRMTDKLDELELPELIERAEEFGAAGASGAKALLGRVLEREAKLYMLWSEGTANRFIRLSHIPVGAEMEVDLFDENSFYRHGKLLRGVKPEALPTPNRQLRLHADGAMQFTVRDNVGEEEPDHLDMGLLEGDTIVLGAQPSLTGRSSADQLFWGRALSYVNLSSKHIGTISAPQRENVIDGIKRNEQLLVGQVWIGGRPIME